MALPVGVYQSTDGFGFIRTKKGSELKVLCSYN